MAASFVRNLDYEVKLALRLVAEVDLHPQLGESPEIY
jgi:hypothetical protein